MEPMDLKPGMSATAQFTVTEEDTAVALGSGALAVLGTPRLLAWCEDVTCRAIQPALTEGSTSVGTRISLEHVAPSPIGASIEVTAGTSYVDGRLVRFAVTARQGARMVGNGEITRVVVDAERFMARVPGVA